MAKLKVLGITPYAVYVLHYLYLDFWMCNVATSPHGSRARAHAHTHTHTHTHTPQDILGLVKLKILGDKLKKGKKKKEKVSYNLQYCSHSLLAGEVS